MSTHHGYIREFPSIRVDAFDGQPELVNPYGGQPASVHLLTHSHTDHITGLNSPKFGGLIYCTAATKNFTTETVEAGERVKAVESILPPKKKFENLFIRPAQGRPIGGKRQRRRTGKEMMRELIFNEPEIIETRDGDVTVTAIDANHCPGSSMFLLEGIDPSGIFRAVIVTGDIRAESWWIESLRKIPALAKYMPDPKGKGKGKAITLDCIYLDTSQAMAPHPRVSKKVAVDACVQDMKRYPPDTKFFINSWTWGYEELLKGISLAFDSKIHFDQYKFNMYSHSSIQQLDPVLSSVGTTDEKATRFHACERRWKCDEVWGDGIGCYCYSEQHLSLLRGPKLRKEPGITAGGSRDYGNQESELVYVNCWEMSTDRFSLYRENMESIFNERKEMVDQTGKRNRKKVDLPKYLICPIARHSTLPELKAFVGLFQPSTIYPLVVDAKLNGLDSLALPALFGDVLGPGGFERLKSQTGEFSAHERKYDINEALQRDQELEGFLAGIGINSKRPIKRMGLWDVNVEGGDEAIAFVQEWATETSNNVLPVAPAVKESTRASELLPSIPIKSTNLKKKKRDGTSNSKTDSTQAMISNNRAKASEVPASKRQRIKPRISTTPDYSPSETSSLPLSSISNLPPRPTNSILQTSRNLIVSTGSSSIVTEASKSFILKSKATSTSFNSIGDTSVDSSLSENSGSTIFSQQRTGLSHLDENQKKIARRIQAQRKKAKSVS